jgi:hypothetical protein
MTSEADKVVDRLQMPREAQDQMERAVPTDVVRGIVSDYVKPVAPGDPTKSLVDRLVEKFGP